MNISLGHKWEEFVDEQVKEGRYQSVSEVLRDGLRLLEKRDGRRFPLPNSFSTRREMEEAVMEGLKGEAMDFGPEERADFLARSLARVEEHRRRKA